MNELLLGSVGCFILYRILGARTLSITLMSMGFSAAVMGMRFGELGLMGGSVLGMMFGLYVSMCKRLAFYK